MTTQTTTTAATITNQQIRALRTEAAEAGDLLQVAICDWALGEVDADDIAERDVLDPADRSRVLAMSVHEARVACARVIAAAEAQ